ncbi:MAG: (5-formylfuran-3-yl)methyl phosphate synthase [Methyloprofundus sp.]|nr:(5-formylfuran-3-yl)methyl phosphate synthase [Methyloprofundus sp.]MDT8424703.1 (5-formylfuran-3-yl)methyl phosphate synthase [Methyloprofundus sp.]
MSKMLASVNSLEEALSAQQARVDIIDLKQPALGALGALDSVDVKAIVVALEQTSSISATVGDLPMQAELIFNAVEKMADTGVDYIKIGFFPGSDWTPIINRLQSLTQRGLKLIAVLFADQQPDLKSLSLFSQAGFNGVMLDTMNKSNGSLTQVMPFATIQAFVKSAKQRQLLCGLAGSLREADIATLLPLQADYLGFRGALCVNHQRTAELDSESLLRIKAALKN